MKAGKVGKEFHHLGKASDFASQLPKLVSVRGTCPDGNVIDWIGQQALHTDPITNTTGDIAVIASGIEVM